MSTGIASMEEARFDRALEQLHEADPQARVALDTDSGLALGVDGTVAVSLPDTASKLPGSDRAAAASVLFLDRYGPLFGIPGWHVLKPLAASPLGRTIWFSFEATTPATTMTAHVCADEHTVKHVRIERAAS